MIVKKMGFAWAIHDGDSVRVAQEQGFIPWTDETNAIAAALDHDHSPVACRRAVEKLQDLYGR